MYKKTCNSFHAWVIYEVYEVSFVFIIIIKMYSQVLQKVNIKYVFFLKTFLVNFSGLESLDAEGKK